MVKEITLEQNATNLKPNSKCAENIAKCCSSDIFPCSQTFPSDSEQLSFLVFKHRNYNVIGYYDTQTKFVQIDA